MISASLAFFEAVPGLDRVRKYDEKFGDGDTIVADMTTETEEVEGKMKVVRTIR